MKYAFSNIAWAPHDSEPVFDLLRANGVTGIEVAPTKIWPQWEGATPEAASRYGLFLRDRGFEVPALQAVLFGRPEAKLFDDEGEAHLFRHLAFVADLAQHLGARAVVLGAPSQRNRGTLDFDSALERAADIMRRLAEVFFARDTCLCIEPNPRQYGCNFVTNVAEAVALVRRVGHPGFGLHLDSAAMYLEGDDLETVWDDARTMVRHFHISEPELGDFRYPLAPHARNLEFLDRMGYERWCSVEMREPKGELAAVGPWALLGAWR